MRYSNLTNKSNVFLKRFTHSSRHIKCSKFIDNINYTNFLDFGSGDGQLFEYLKTKKTNIIISVPLEEGLSSFLENLICFDSEYIHKVLTVKNLFKSIFYRKINRGSRVYYNSHIGFNHHDLKKILANHFTITNIAYTPFDSLKSILNSQIFFICKI